MLLSSFILLVVLFMHQSCLNEINALRTQSESETQGESETQSETETQSESEEQSEEIEIGQRSAQLTKPEIVFPDNIAAVVGNEVTLTCRGRYGSDKMQWQFLAVGSTTPLSIVDNCKVDTRHAAAYEVVSTDNACNLRLESVTLELAGTYTCIDSSRSQSFTVSSKLIVLAAEPACKTSVDKHKTVKVGTEVTFSCSVQYSGAAAPAIQFTNEFQEVMPVSSVISTATNVETSFMTTAAKPTIRPYTAKTYFNEIVLPPVLGGEKMKFRAQNIPNYVYNWIFKEMSVA